MRFLLVPVAALLALASTVLLAQREPQAAPAAAGAALFQRSCASCHNVEGRAPSLTSGVFGHGGEDAQIAQTIRAGVPGTQMPPFPQLSADAIAQLIAYIRSLPAAPTRGSATTGPPPAIDPAAAADPHLTFERIRGAASEPHNWLTYWGNYQGTHYSALPQITAANAGRLQVAWAKQLQGSSVLEATPLVVDGVMYTSGPPGVVVALDAATGRQIWRYQRTQKVRNPNEINPYNRGVAILGHRLFVGTLDAALLALDARTGALLWEVQMADPLQGFSITSPPLPLEDKIIAGIAGGEFGIRGFVDAYDPATGARLWRFSAIPGPGEFGHDTWAGDSWKLGCGATWLPGSYDPDLKLLYWAIGNPCPLYNGAIRGGDNLFTSSVVALDPATGQRRWHYQFSPHDTHDWDSNQDMMLVDRVFHGAPRKLLMHADRNGHFYVLDRTNGTFLSGTPFTTQTWNSGFDASGRPILADGSQATAAGSVIAPSIGGATNFQAPSYSPATGLVYLAYQDGAQRYFSETQPFESGRQYPGGRGAAAGAARTAGIKAIDPENGKTVWNFPLTEGSLTAGVLATAGSVVFASSREGYLYALDARSGAPLWKFQTGAAIAASPISYSVAGRQFVAVSAGNVVYSVALPEDVPYAVQRGADVVRLEDTARGVAVTIAPGAGNLTREMTVHGHNILGPLGIPFLAPWANRLDEQAFYANGKRYAFDMALGNVRGAHPIHGLLAAARWDVVEAKADQTAAWVTSRLEFFRQPDWMAQFPFAHTIEMTHRLQDGVLDVTVALHNVSADPMPVAVGFHPYFRLDDAARDAWTIALGARTEWLLAPDKIPTGETAPIERRFPDPQRAILAGHDLDHVFGDLIRDASGRAVMSLAGASQRIDVVFGPNYRAAVVYAPAGRDFICFEPMAGITDALNLAQRGLYKDLQQIPSGGTWKESFSVRPSGF